MAKFAQVLRGSLLLFAIIFSLLVPQLAWAQSLSSHASITMTTQPERPVAKQETRLIIGLKDKNQQPIANAPVQIRAEMVMTGMAGMNHGSAGPTTVAKPTDKPGEYAASLTLSDVGDWKITVISGDSSAQFGIAAAAAGAPSTKATSPSSNPAPQRASVKVASSSVKASSMEAVHASYLELVGNIADLRSRVDQWKKGDADSLKIADEKLERTQVVLGSITWPEVMAKAVITTTNAITPMAKALKDKDLVAAEPAAKGLGDGSHDVTHAFYGDWLPALEGIRFSPMAPHAIYLDLSANIADLRDRVTQWQKGDESSLNIAKEKAERIEVLLPHLTPSSMLLKPAQAIDKDLPAVVRALEKKDVVAAQTALKPIADASHDLTHEFYSWMDVSGGGNDLACVLASYRDLTLNISDLRQRVTLWQQGDEDSYKIAQEKLERIEIVLAHPTWPAAMGAGIGKTEGAIKSMAKALKDKDLASAQAVSTILGDGSHDVTHNYFGDWLPSIQLGADEGQIATTQGRTVAGGHGHDDGAAESSGPNYYFVGSTLGAILITIVMVPILRRRDLRAQKVEAD